MEVDTETGAVKMLRHVAVDDCGKILNPMLVTGQQHGGIALEGRGAEVGDRVHIVAERHGELDGLERLAFGDAALGTRALPVPEAEAGGGHPACFAVYLPLEERQLQAAQ